MISNKDSAHNQIIYYDEIPALSQWSANQIPNLCAEVLGRQAAKRALNAQTLTTKMETFGNCAEFLAWYLIVKRVSHC